MPPTSKPHKRSQPLKLPDGEFFGPFEASRFPDFVGDRFDGRIRLWGMTGRVLMKLMNPGESAGPQRWNLRMSSPVRKRLTVQVSNHAAALEAAVLMIRQECRKLYGPPRGAGSDSVESGGDIHMSQNPKKITLCTLATGRHGEIAEITLPAMKAWCEAFGMDLHHYTSLPHPSRNASWNKIPIVQHHLRHYEQVIWMDIDTLILQHWKPELIFANGNRMTVSADFNGACLGAFSLNRNTWSFSLLEALWFLGPTVAPQPFDNRDTWEQNTFKALERFFPAVSSMVLPLNPRTTIANPDTFGLSPDAPPLAYHAWANRGIDIVLQELKEIQTDIPAWVAKRK